MLFKTLYCPSCEGAFPREEADETQTFYMCHECRARRARDRHEQKPTRESERKAEKAGT